MKFYKLLPLLFILFTFGCSSKYAVTYDSTPQGASLVCSGKNWGHTPKKLYYDESVKKQSSMNVSDCSANWVSGASKSYPSNIPIFSSGGTHVTVDRPNGDGYAIDANYALQLRQTRAAESTSAAQNNNSNSTQACTKIGDFSGRVYYFETGYCPVGYWPN